jgi:hypothetical protein
MEIGKALDIRYWPDLPRRIFVLTLPISGPIWLALIALAFLVLFVVLCVLVPVKMARALWRGFE